MGTNLMVGWGGKWGEILIVGGLLRVVIVDCVGDVDSGGDGVWLSGAGLLGEGGCGFNG